ncbi:hypothetical protein MHC_05030 [Mycoplasma haemocanis str. Illinois]|uniref:Uncharacterized protein n=1 Tax=Mycoplasma haemocanis (strain Illinois) TaxID=1111676 RepID=H6N890_MYCHN|nr:hypothetical protein [Mycoplasma haemocanis]AEW45862.1 hypothetical protein MHC_05030 [Mycoplasma haemocanis str. Illinois]
MFFLHYPVAWVFQSFVSFAASTEINSTIKVDYADVANKYATLKYSNDYLRFWDKVSDNASLRAQKVQSIHSDPKAFKFFNEKKVEKNSWKNLVIFCRKMRDKIENGENLNNGQLRYISFCDKDSSISRSKDINTRSYWVDQLARVQYKAEDFAFWDKLSERFDERTHKLYNLRQQGYTGSLEEILGRAKSECQEVRAKFNTEKRFTEEDLNTNIPKCISYLKTIR